MGTAIQKTPKETKDLRAKMNICNYCLTPGHITNRCPLKKFGCATCSRYGEDKKIVKTHLSWNCNRHPGLVELHATTLELKKITTTAKVLRTTTDQEDHENKEQNSFEITHNGNQSQDEEDENTQTYKHIQTHKHIYTHTNTQTHLNTYTNTQT